MTKFRTFMALVALGLAGGSIFIIPYIRYVFYEPQMTVMGINNEQSSLMITIFALTAIILFIPGGILADKFAAKNLMVISLSGVTVVTVIYAFTFDYKSALVLWVLLAIFSATTFWSCLIKAISLIGEAKDQGKSYGIYYAINGVSAAIINTIALGVYTLGETARQGLFYAMLVVAGGTLLATILVFFFFNSDKKKEAEATTLNDEKFRLADVKYAIKNPHTWVLAIINFVSYILYTHQNYFNPYLIDVIGVSPEASGVFSIIRTYVFMLLAIVGGIMCDRVFKSSAKWFMTAYAVSGVLIVGLMLMPKDVSVMFVSVYTLIPAAFIMAQYGVQFSIIRELNIPASVIGTSIGVSSMLSWLSDVIVPPIFGSWLDNFANEGYTYIFIFLIADAAVGIIAAYSIVRYNKRKALGQLD